MRRLNKLYASTVGKKILMAVSGAILVLFVLGHMAGNLKAFQGPEAFNAYAEGIREVGYPFLPHRGALWIMRIALLGAVGVHIWAALVLYLKSRAARAVEYRKKESLSFSYASRTMRWGGVIILAFVVYHLLHFTTGTAHHDFIPGDAYHNLVAGFENPLIALAYMVAVGALAFHLYHGIWSVFQTVGANNPRYNLFRRPLAGVLTGLVFVGFIIVPVAVLAGWIS
ncbi:MAG: succinate dehydrogenase cytochrome b subunit [Longimicrobiales bacterium]|nr:succinate dehydrogenase cytochrome b subunit [Longimicrobiales bacterium]